MTLKLPSKYELADGGEPSSLDEIFNITLGKQCERKFDMVYPYVMQIEGKLVKVYARTCFSRHAYENNVLRRYEVTIHISTRERYDDFNMITKTFNAEINTKFTDVTEPKVAKRKDKDDKVSPSPVKKTK